MIKKLLYIFLLPVLAGLFTACEKKADRKMPSLDETFSSADKNPFGTYIAHRQMENMYTKNTVRDKKQAFDKTWNEISDTAALYVCIAPYLFVNDEEVKAMMDYVYAGNSLFIAASYIDEGLTKQAKCKTKLTLFNTFGLDSVRNTNTKSIDSSFSYYYKPFDNFFTENDSVFSKVLGVNEDNKPNYIVFFHGKGKLFLHCEPRAFSNYFLLKNENYKYLQQALSYTTDEPSHVYWDDYYRKRFSRRSSSSNDKSFSSFSEIMKHPPLKAAFWLSLVLLLLFVLLGIKRRQRIIPKIKPNENTSVTFTETIGRLYLQKKDNKNIAEKSCTYFNEHIRNKYFLNTNAVNDDFITTLSRKSGVEREKVDALYRAINHVNNSESIDDYQLLSLNDQIQYFYKNS